MTRRYFVKQRAMRNGEVTESAFVFGRFRSLDEAEGAAKRSFGKWDSEVLGVWPESRLQAGVWWLVRFAMRVARIAVGITIGFFAVGFLWNGQNVGDIPFSELTLNMIVGAILRGIATLIAISIAWFTAFGPGPDA